MGYTIYFRINNPVKNLVEHSASLREIWYSKDSYERKCILSSRIPEHKTDVEAIDKYLQAFKRIVADTKKLYANLPPNTTSAGGGYENNPLTIKGADGTGEPLFCPYDGIIFNGDSSIDMDHETLCLIPFDTDNLNFFCKTARKPYDLLVKAVLISAKRHFGKNMTLDSDGEISDWKETIQLYQDTLKRKVNKHWFKEIRKSNDYSL